MKVQETGKHSISSQNVCGSKSPNRHSLLFLIHQCIQSHFALSKVIFTEESYRGCADKNIPGLYRKHEFWVQMVPWWCSHALDHKPMSPSDQLPVLPWPSGKVSLSCSQCPFSQLQLRCQWAELAHLDPFFGSPAKKLPSLGN